MNGVWWSIPLPASSRAMEASLEYLGYGLFVIISEYLKNLYAVFSSEPLFGITFDNF